MVPRGNGMVMPFEFGSSGSHGGRPLRSWMKRGEQFVKASVSVRLILYMRYIAFHTLKTKLLTVEV